MTTSSDSLQDWHRLFGLILTDFFTGTPFAVETEVDLSLKQQFLDVVVIRKQPGAVAFALPDGLHDLAEYNLLSFKSYRETLNAWSMKELVGHYVNYRKRTSPSLKQLLPEEEFRLFAVSACYPRELARQVALEPLQPGVFACRWGTDTIRVLVLHQLAREDHNALWHLFSASEEQVAFGARHYVQHSPDTSTLILQLLVGYECEGITMPYTMEQFRQDFRKNMLKSLTPAERLEGVSAEELLKSLPAEERLKGLPAEERLKGLPAEERLKGLPAEERLKGLPAEERLKGLPAEERLKGLPAEERVKGLSPEDLLKVLPPDVLQALRERMRQDESSPQKP